ncbi:hypothetical protein BUALT_Bualt11G0004900 [Buddleja alternifolia]|uniref:TFIIS N-terminal domain-containing protein n=1 Tax=Buddleja alternifolia TaxID=168488 RepID=A0AAV6X232_9LAMI|nr:hypothetical protein BUALT_Bualt11G0004900 [Buddleja alternifolia]
MDANEFRAILSRSRVGIWKLIEGAISVATSDHGEELRRRRDRIVESLYTPAEQLCRSCNGDIHDDVFHGGDRCCDDTNYNNNNTTDNINNNSNITLNDSKNRNLNEDFSKSPESNHTNFSGHGGEEEEEDLDPYAALYCGGIAAKLSRYGYHIPGSQGENCIYLFEETDIGRHVNRLRKHPSNEVRGLVKQLVRKWKETVDEWVKVNQPQATSNLIADGDSPQQNIPKNQQNTHHQVPDFGYSQNLRNGSSTAERNCVEHETKTKPRPPQSAPRREAPSRPPQSVPKPASAPPNRAQREQVVDDERLKSARKRLQENYQEAQNAKKQRTIQVMDIHEIPKPKNGFISKNKGGFQGRHHR